MALLPREGDQPVFAEPWQAQAFALAVTLSKLGHFTWKEWAAALAEELRLAQVGEVLLEVRASNCPALALYRALGFAETGRRPLYYVDPEEDALLLRLRLA